MADRGISTLGTLSYDDVVFDWSTITTATNVRPVYDRAGRTVVYICYTFTFSTHLHADTASEFKNKCEALRRKLTKPGRRFVYQGRGCVDLDLNNPATPTGPRDVAYGPQTRALDFRHQGNGVSGEMTWTVEVNAPDCADAVYQGRPMELAFTVSIGRLRDGRATRTTSGTLRIPAALIGGTRNLPDVADAYRAQVVAPVPYGFDRKYDPFVSDEAKTTLNFSYTDTEMPANIYPPGVVEATANHNITSAKPGFHHWNGVITAEYVLEKRGDPNLAVLAFARLIKDRLTEVNKPATNSTADLPPPKAVVDKSPFLPIVIESLSAKPGAPSLGATPEASESQIIPTYFSMGEPEIYGERRVQLTLGYTAVNYSLATMLSRGGLWRPVPDSDWNTWYASLKDTVLSAYGPALLQFKATDDHVVDLCEVQPSEPPPAPPGFVFPPGQRPNLPVDAEGENFTTQLKAGTLPSILRSVIPTPSKENSWIHFDNVIRVEVDQGIVPMTLLPDAVPDAARDVFSSTRDFLGVAFNALSPALAGAAGTSFGPATSTALPPASTANSVRIVRRSNPVVHVFLTGKALRYGYPVDEPRLDSIGGVKATPVNRPSHGEGIRRSVVAALGAPIHGASWNLRYVLDRLPDQPITSPPNPFHGDTRATA